MKVKSHLLKGLDPDQVVNFKADFVSASILRKRLMEVLTEKIESKRTSVSRDYSNPNWANHVAHAFGYEEAMKEVISILSGVEE
jgi:hypothetical protein